MGNMNMTLCVFNQTAEHRAVSIMLVCALFALLGAAPAPSSAESPNTVDYVRDIQPIFFDQCRRCHGPDKQKGKYRLDRKEFAFGDQAIVPHQPDESFLIELIRLPEDDPELMPQDAPPLKPGQIDLIEQWIAQGAVWPDGVDDAPKRISPLIIVVPTLTESQIHAEILAIHTLHQHGVVAQRLANNTQALDVNFSLIGAGVNDANLQQLQGLEHTLVWLDLGGAAITDAGLASLTSFKQIRRLQLQNTRITNAGVQHLVALNQLTHLNLYGAEITDAALTHIQSLKQLKKIYLWRTHVTPKGVAELQRALPELLIDLGGYDQHISLVTPRVQTPPAAEMSLDIKQVMAQHKKDGLLDKVLNESSDEADRRKLVELYEFLVTAPPLKGDAKSWRQRTNALLNAARKMVQSQDETTLLGLKNASNCRACHSMHRP